MADGADAAAAGQRHGQQELVGQVGADRAPCTPYRSLCLVLTQVVLPTLATEPQRGPLPLGASGALAASGHRHETTQRLRCPRQPSGMRLAFLASQVSKLCRDGFTARLKVRLRSPQK